MYCLNKKTHRLFIELIIAKVSIYITNAIDSLLAEHHASKKWKNPCNLKLM